MKLGSSSNIEIGQVFSRFKRIPKEAYHDYIYFYQSYFSQIEQMNFEEYAEIKYNYIKALYYLDRINQFHVQVDYFLTELINHNKFEPEHREIYEGVLFLKAKVLKNDLKQIETIKLLSQLYKLNPFNKKVSSMLVKLVFQEEQHKSKIWTALIVLLLIITLGFTSIYFLFFQSFRPEYMAMAIIIRNVSFLGSLVLFTCLNAYIVYKVYVYKRDLLKNR